MKRFMLVSLFAAVSVSIAGAMSIDEVLQKSNLRDRVVVEGTVKRSFDFDNFLITDGTNEIAASFIGVKQNLDVDDKVVVYGRYRGKFVYANRYALIETIQWAPQGSKEAEALRAKYDKKEPPKPEPVGPPVPPASSNVSIESRLRQLEELKQKKLITDEEYAAHRKRILDGL